MSYTFDNAAVVASTQRFDCLERCYDPVSAARLRALGVCDSWRCLEVGAGGGSLANWLADQVGERGSVVATDIDTALVAPVRANVEVWQHDIVSDPLPQASFDLIHARLVLLHLPERRRALHQMWHALKPGGRLLLDEFDCTWLPVLAAPDRAAAGLFARVVDGIHELLQRAGADLAWGRHAYSAMVDTGFTDLSVHGYSQAWPGGSPGARLHQANAVQTGDRLRETGLVTAIELRDFLNLVEDPLLVVSSYLMLSTSGRRPPEPAR